MTNETRERALAALRKTRAAMGSDFYFPMVFVIDSHIFFTYMAAVRMQRYIAHYEKRDCQIEKVLSPFTSHVKTNEDQRGNLMPGEVFPSKEYAQLINA